MAKSKPGKYDAVLARGQWDKLPVENTQYQDKVNEAKATITENTTHTAESLAKIYLIWREAKDELDERAKHVNLHLEAIEQLLVESYEMTDAGWGLYGAKPNAVRLADGTTVTVRMEPAGKVLDKDAFREWCLANDLGRSLQLWPTTMNSITKERLLSGLPLPDGVKAFILPKVIRRRGDDKDSE